MDSSTDIREFRRVALRELCDIQDKLMLAMQESDPSVELGILSDPDGQAFVELSVREERRCVSRTLLTAEESTQLSMALADVATLVDTAERRYDSPPPRR